jgi:putative ABC transport system permease protein
MNRRDPAPSGIVRKILTRLFPAVERESLMGDLDEIEAEIAAQHGPAKARRWRRRQILRLMPASIIDSFVWRNTMIKNYGKMTWRNLKKHPGYTAINIAGLAAGLACCLIILIWCRSELSFDRFHEGSDRLFRVFQKWENGGYGTFLPGPLSAHLHQTFPEITDAAIVSISRNVKVSAGPDKGFFATCGLAEPSFFEMFTFPLLHGDSRTVFDNPAAVVITEGLAERLFGRAEPIGRSLRLNDGQTDMIVTGVLRRIPVNSSLQFDLLRPAVSAKPIFRNWDVNVTPIFVRLRDDASPDDVRRKIAGILKARNPKHTSTLGLQPLKDVRLREPGGGGRIVNIYIFAAMALVILLIAAVNFMNLATARAEKRAAEIGIRKVLGSSRGQLVLQFLSESVLLTFLSLLIAAVSAKALLPSINTLLGQPIEMPLSWSLIGAMAAIAFFVGLLAGSYPAFLLSGVQPLAAFKGHRRAAGRGMRGRRRAQTRGAALRKILVVVQLAASIFFIVGLSVINRQMGLVKSMSLGFDKDNVILLSLQGDLSRSSRILKNDLLKNPDILSASMSRGVLDEWRSSSSVDWTGKRPDDHVVLGFEWVDEDYLRTLKLQMAAGRFFSSAYAGDTANSVVINETAAKAMGMAQPIGQRISYLMGEKIERTIVGVVKDFHTESLHAPVEPFALFHSGSESNMYIRIKSADIPKTLRTIEQAVRTVVPSDPFQYRFLDEALNDLYQSEQTMGKLVVAAAVLAILITCLGLFGLISYMTERRTKEIAIRKVMGASTIGIAGLFLKEIVVGVGLAVAVAAPLSFWAAKKWLQDFSYRIAFSPWMVLFAGSAVLAIAVLTISYQTLRAASSNPIEAIHYE